MKEKLVLLDASAIIYRAFFALPPLTTKDGRLINAAFGFAQILLKILNEVKPDYLACAFDSKKPTFRHREYKGYKAKRLKRGEELYSQFPIVKKILESFSIPIYEIEGFEADDVIASLKNIVGKLKSKNLEIVIVTGDLDVLQLVDPFTKVYAMRKGLTDIIVYDEEKVLEKYGFRPFCLPDFKALAGDPSDNIPGVKGIGEKTAINLIKTYGNIETIYQNIDKQPDKIRYLLDRGRKQAALSKRLAILKKDVPIKIDFKKLKFGNYNLNEVIKLFSQLGFKSLLPRLPGISLSHIEELKTDKIKTRSDEIDVRVGPILKEMEKVGIKIDVAHLARLSKEIENKIQKIKLEIFEACGGQFNLDSPRQLAQILFNRLALNIRGIKKTKTGISTSASELLKLKDAHPVINKILKYRELSKLKNTYLDTLPKLVDENFRLHTTYTQETQTGRIASRSPNLQNIPIKTELGKEIRKAFIAESGWRLVSADYSQIELRIAAHLSEDEKLIAAFKRGEDIHDSVSRALGVDRRIAKAINYGILYGISPYGLAETLKISPQMAQVYIERFFGLYPKLKTFIKRSILKAKKQGYVETIFGRRRYLPEINSPLASTRSAAERMAVNMPCQGSAADVLKLAMIRIVERLKEMKVNKVARLLLTVHDELVFEVVEAQVREISLLIKKEMESVVKLRVPLLVGVSQGKNWGEMIKLK